MLGAELEVPRERQEARARHALPHGAERVDAGYEPRMVRALGAVGGVGAVGDSDGNSGEDLF